jgi:extracellular factor (EF) 3-hydroxypalmitic acid methyl ester biosynthesis protein
LNDRSGQSNGAGVNPLSSSGLKNDSISLDAAIERFRSRLEQLDRKSEDPHADHGLFASLTAEAIMDMRTAVESFEKAAGQDPVFIKAARNAFREKTRTLFAKSYFMDHARTWPQGYPGDYLILEGVYRNSARSKNIGLYLDQYFLSTTLAVAVRARRDKLFELLKFELRERKEPRILDIACGPCHEVLELAPTIKNNHASMICLDFDPDALLFSEERLSQAGCASGQISFRKYNALKMISPERNEKEFGRQDVIYSVGFFDYLSDDMLARLLRALYHLLNPGGCLIASFKDSRRYTTFDYHWLVEWDAFLQRTEEEMWALFGKADIPAEKITTVRDGSGVILFFKALR